MREIADSMLHFLALYGVGAVVWAEWSAVNIVAGLWMLRNDNLREHVALRFGVAPNAPMPSAAWIIGMILIRAAIWPYSVVRAIQASPVAARNFAAAIQHHRAWRVPERLRHVPTLAPPRPKFGIGSRVCLTEEDDGTRPVAVWIVRGMLPAGIYWTMSRSETETAESVYFVRAAWGDRGYLLEVCNCQLRRATMREVVAATVRALL